MAKRRFEAARARILLRSSIALAVVAGALVPTSASAQDYTLGIDVSHHQGTINWTRVAESGHVYAFHKATEGATFTDPNYATNRSKAATASVPFGAYHFARPQGGSISAAQSDARSEAQHFLAVARPEPGDLIPVLDMEATGSLPDQRLIAWTQAWLDEIVAAIDVHPLIYTSPAFWRENLANTTTFAEQGFPLWIAHYTSAAAPTTPAGNWDGNGWAFWQWTNCASIPGISGCVDENRYVGSDLSPYIIPGAPEPEPTPDEATPPTNQSRPQISGRAEVGEKLTATSGEWGGSQPQSYSYSWRRCEQDGTGCSAVLRGTKPTYTLQPVDFHHRMKVIVTATNSAGSAEAESNTSDVVVDTTAPNVPRVVRPRRQQTLKSTLNVAWSRVEDNARYDVRYRRAGRDGQFGEVRDLVVGSVDTTAQLDARPGRTYCFSARAHDTASNTSDWSSEKCTAVPLDDRGLSASSGWNARSSDDTYLGTYMRSSQRNSLLALRNVGATRVAVVVSVCSGCGRIAVSLDGERIGTVDLSARRSRTKQVIEVARFDSLRSGYVEIKVISNRAPVKIDGLVLSAV